MSKTVPATTAQLVKAFTNARKRNGWISEADPKLSDALSKGLADKKSKGWVIRPDGLARFRYKWDDTIVQFYAYPNGDAVERYRAQWKTAFGLLADYFNA